MAIWDFVGRASDAWHAGNSTSGVFHASGSLFILWTLSTLIAAEMNYLLTGRTSVHVFIKVAMISVIREMIVYKLVSDSRQNETVKIPEKQNR